MKVMTGINMDVMKNPTRHGCLPRCRQWTYKFVQRDWAWSVLAGTTGYLAKAEKNNLFVTFRQPSDMHTYIGVCAKFH